MREGEHQAGPVGSTIVSWRSEDGGICDAVLHVDIETVDLHPYIAVDANGARFTAGQARSLANLLTTAAARLDLWE